MNKRKNEEISKFLLTKKEFKLFIALKNKISDYLEILNYQYTKEKIPYSVMVLQASEKSIKETLSNIRKTDILLKIPYLPHHYLLFFQNSSCKDSIEIGSRLTSLIERTFMLNQKNISHKAALICFEENPPKILDLCYEIILTIKNIKNNDSNDFWIGIERI